MNKKWWIVVVVALAVAVIAIVSFNINDSETETNSKTDSETKITKKEKEKDIVPFIQEIDSDKELHEKGFDIQDFYAMIYNDEGKTMKEGLTEEILELEESYDFIKEHADKAIVKELDIYTKTVQDLLLQQNELDHSLRYLEVSVDNPRNMYIYILDSKNIDKKAEDAIFRFIYNTNIDYIDFQNIIDEEYIPSKEEFIDIYIPHLILDYITSYDELFDFLEEKLEYLEEEAYIFDINYERDEPKLTETLKENLMEVYSYDDLYNKWLYEHYYNKISETSHYSYLKTYYELLMEGKSSEEVFGWIKERGSN